MNYNQYPEVNLISQPASLSMPLLCRGDADKLEHTLSSIAVAATADDLWIEILLVSWQLTPCGMERASAALASHTRLVWLEHNASSEQAVLQQAWRQARGSWIWWLEAGDQLTPAALVDWFNVVKQEPQLLLVAGEGEHLAWDGQALRRHHARPTSTWVPQLTIQGLYCPGAIVWRRSLLALSTALREEHGPAHLQLCLMETLAVHSRRCLAVPQLWVRTRSASDWQRPGRCRGQAMALTQCLAAQLGDAPGDMLHTYGLQLQRGEALPPPGRTWLDELADAITTAEPLLSAPTLLRLRQGWGLDPDVQPWQELLETHLAATGLQDLWCVTLLRNLLHPELGALHLGSPWGPNLRLAVRLVSTEYWGQYLLLRQDAEVQEVLNQSVQGLPLIGLLHWLEQPQLQQRYPLPEALQPYGRWWSDHAQSELSHIRFGAGGLIETEPYAESNPSPREARPFGVNLIGHAFEVFGVGEDVRMAAIAMQSASIPFCVVNVPALNGTSQGERSLEPYTLPAGKQGPYRFNLVCMTAIDHGRWIARSGLESQINRTTIVAWPWETQIWPARWHCVLRLADAFWPSSSFTAKALQPFSDPSRKPLKVMPMTVDITQPERYLNQDHREHTRLKWGLNPRAFLVIFIFDVRSSLARKNPWGAIDAFQQAFAEQPESKVQLVIKTLRPTSDNCEWKKLISCASNDSRITLISEDLCREELLSIIGSCDVFLSLHRSEGFGRCIAEAGILGLNIIASNFGGNVDFCKGERFHMIPCRPWPIPSGIYPDADGHIWGDPDISTASKVLRHLFHRAEEKWQQEECNHYLANLSPQKCGERYARQLRALRHLPCDNSQKRLESNRTDLSKPGQ